VHDASDAELVARVLGGNVDAYGALVRRYQNAYIRFATRMLGSYDDADDALQSAFVRAYRKLPECRDPAHFGAWLYQIAINECRTVAARHNRRELRLVRDERALQYLSNPGSDDPTADLEPIQTALDQLEPEQREAFILKHVEDLSYEEMSALTGVGISALKMRVKRAREGLQRLLGPTRSLS
jgi:RNA polymerase sigma-70 factor (ECF subfamily)